MSADAPSSAAKAPAPPHAIAATWEELEEVADQLSQLARQPLSVADFYHRLLEHSIRAMSARGGVAWLRMPDGFMRPVAEQHTPGGLFASAEDRRRHDLLLAEVAGEGNVAARTFQTTGGDAAQAVLVLGAVKAVSPSASSPLVDDTDRPTGNPVVAVVEIIQRPDASPATYRGQERFLATVCDIAAEYHAFAELARLRGGDHFHSQLLELSHRVHRDLDLEATAFAVANEGRRVLGCDRLSVAVPRGRHLRLVAASGVKRIERRAGAVRQLEALAEMAWRTGEPFFYGAGATDALPQVAEKLEHYVDQSHARQVAILPVWVRRPPADDQNRHAARDEPVAVLVAEQFDGQTAQLGRDRVTEVGDICATALYQATEWQRLPLRWLLQPLGQLRRTVPQHLGKFTLAALVAAAIVAALVFVPADFSVEASGRLQPSVRRDAFASRSGLVDEILVEHGDDVAAGQVLVRLRDPQLQLELKRISGELQTTMRQLDAVRATKTDRATRDTGAIEAYRLSADEAEFQQRLANLQRQLELLEEQQAALAIRSPIAGRVLTWNVDGLLAARPVERGQVLLTVADLGSPWQLELEVADDRIGYVMDAREDVRADLAVRFKLASDDREQRTGRITQIARIAAADADAPSDAQPTVEVIVALDQPQFEEPLRRDWRPGVTARAQIHCGQRSLGYVWLHDICDALVEWATF